MFHRTPFMFHPTPFMFHRPRFMFRQPRQPQTPAPDPSLKATTCGPTEALRRRGPTSGDRHGSARARQ